MISRFVIAALVLSLLLAGCEPLPFAVPRPEGVPFPEMCYHRDVDCLSWVNGTKGECMAEYSRLIEVQGFEARWIDLTPRDYGFPYVWVCAYPKNSSFPLGRSYDPKVGP